MLLSRLVLVRRTDQQHRFVWAAPDTAGALPAPSRKAHNGSSFKNHDSSGTAHYKGATSMQTHPAVRVGYELATDGIQFYVFATSYGEAARRCFQAFLSTVGLQLPLNPRVPFLACDLACLPVVCTV